MRLHSVMLCGRISFALPRANLVRSSTPVSLPAALRFGHSSTPNTETEVHNEGNQFAGFLPVVYGRCDGRSHGGSCGRIAGRLAVHKGQPPPCLSQQGALLAGRQGRYRVFRLLLHPLPTGANAKPTMPRHLDRRNNRYCGIFIN